MNRAYIIIFAGTVVCTFPFYILFGARMMDLFSNIPLAWLPQLETDIYISAPTEYTFP